MSTRLQKNLKKKLVLLVVSTLFISSQAVDLGVSGKIFNIDEVDIRVKMIESLSKNLTKEAFKDEAEKISKNFYKNLPMFGLAPSRKTHTEHIDPTRVYEDDYWSFKKNDVGDYEWYKISDAGKSVNWLEHSDSPMQKFFIFDANSDVQVNIAREIAAKKNHFVTLVITGGDLEKAVQDVGDDLTYINESIIREYDLQYVPVVISRGRNNFKNYYRKTRFDIGSVTSSIVMDELEIK